jgi:predicted regulator of Ras-like GTPase activity (Roadblock/LC7/MglB family)
MNIEGALKEAMTVDGAIGVALVDFDSGMSLGFLGGGPGLDLEIAAAGNTEVVRAKMRTLARLGLNETVEDVLITLSGQYHVIRLLPGGSLFLYLALDRSRANLALARHELRRIGATLEV